MCHLIVDFIVIIIIFYVIILMAAAVLAYPELLALAYPL